MSEKTLRLLEKALLASPDDWETRAHLIDEYSAASQPHKADALIKAAPQIPDTEADALRIARVQIETAPAAAQQRLEQVLSRNKACAQAYLLLARILQKRGLREEARLKYGAATIIDESWRDPALELRLGLAPESVPPVNTLPVAEDHSRQETPAALVGEETADNAQALEQPEMPKVTFDDIGGMEEVIERIRMNIIYPFRNPEVFRKFNRKSGGGILLYGPPGCGKTHIARATAGECGAVFVSIAITDILSKWLGESEQRLHQLFESARRRAPTVLFIDEIDAIGVSRSDATPAMSSLVNVLLTEMDGISSKNDQVMILAATNTPWRVDDALRRPGRFDRVLFVPPPDAPAREAILKICLRNLPADKMDLSKLARSTDRFSGADLRAVVERASEKAIFQEMRTGRSAMITQTMLADTIKEMRPSTNEWLETARSYASYANRSGLYDELVNYFEKH